MCGHMFCRSCITMEAEFQATRTGSIAHENPGEYGLPDLQRFSSEGVAVSNYPWLPPSGRIPSEGGLKV